MNTDMKYTTDKTLLDELKLEGFFVGWPKPPYPHTLKQILLNSRHIVIAYEDQKLVGFINAISDGILSAYIPLLEVLPDYQGLGVGKELVLRMKNELKNYYMVDLSCDEEMTSFYRKLGFKQNHSMYIRKYDRQSGD